MEMAKSAGAAAQKARDLQERARQAMEEHLRERGWKYRCDTPGCFWMWCKVWRGEQWTFNNAETALRAQSWMEEMGEDAAASSSEGKGVGNG
jgi:hypothetical protein